MTAPIAASYDAVAPLYAELFLGDLDDNPLQREHVDRFAGLARNANGVVLDVGCGPGHVVGYLRARDVDAIGYDISAGMLAQARVHFPDAPVALADFGALPQARGSVGALLARYSVIHADPASLPEVFAHWAEMLEPQAPLLMFFFAASTADRHGEPFDHKAATAYELSADVLAGQLEAAGFVHVVPTTRPPVRGGRQIDQGWIVAKSG